MQKDQQSLGRARLQVQTLLTVRSSRQTTKIQSHFAGNSGFPS